MSKFNPAEDLKKIPKFDQTQIDLETQLLFLATVADRIGLYDAGDYLYKKIGKKP